MNNKLFIVLIIFLKTVFSYSQDEKKIIDIVKKSNSSYTNKSNIAVALDYNLFQDYTSKKILQSYKGLSVSTKNCIYLKIYKTEFLKTKNLSFKINHDQKTSLVNISGKSGELNTQNPLDLKVFLKHFKKKTLKSENNNWVIELETPKLTQLPYGKAKIFINKSDYSIQKQVLYLLNGLSFENKVTKSPRLEINLKNLTKTDLEINSLVDLNRFLVKEANTYKLKKEYAHYKLLKY